MFYLFELIREMIWIFDVRNELHEMNKYLILIKKKSSKLLVNSSSISLLRVLNSQKNGSLSQSLGVLNSFRGSAVAYLHDKTQIFTLKNTSWLYFHPEYPS